MALVNKSRNAWAEAAHKSPLGAFAPELHRAIDTIQSVTEGTIDPRTGAANISSIFDPVIKRRIRPSPTNAFWGIFCEAVKAIGANDESTERLAELLTSIRALPDVTDENGNAIVHEEETGAVIWRSLPYFAFTFWEDVIDLTEDDTDLVQGDSLAVPLLNGAAFGALYINRDDYGHDMCAFISIIRGIEVPYETPEDYREAEIYVPPAATWILLAGKAVYERCKSGKVNGYAVDEVTWKIPAGVGFSLGRWAFWKKRFRVISMTQGLRDDLRDLASKAINKMEELDSAEVKAAKWS